MPGDVTGRWGPPGPGAPALGAGEAHVWRFGLDPGADALSALERLLSPDELRRADRFRRPDLRRRFVTARAGLRRVLAGYAGCPAGRIAFAYGPHGKPSLASPAGETPFEFNLSHSGEVALLAVTRAGAVGVDVEAVRPMEDHGGRLIGRYFSAREQAEFLALPDGERLAAFFRGWTRKEAFLKAVGTGLATELHSFDISLGPSAPPAVLRVGDDPGAEARWSLREIDPGPGYAAALAVETRGGPLRVALFEFDPGDRLSPPDGPP